MFLKFKLIINIEHKSKKACGADSKWNKYEKNQAGEQKYHVTELESKRGKENVFDHSNLCLRDNHNFYFR